MLGHYSSLEKTRRKRLFHSPAQIQRDDNAKEMKSGMEKEEKLMLANKFQF